MIDQTKQKAAVFLDRDGTINEEIGYLDRPEKLRLLPGVARAIRIINESGLLVVVVTNQSGVARGYFNEAAVAAIHQQLQEMLATQGARIDRFYYCPHHPTNGLGSYLLNCPCRKPSPGMLLRAAADLDISLEDSYIIGDTAKDIEAGGRIGVSGILVKTGYGAETAKELAAAEQEDATIHRPLFVAVNLEEAVSWIIATNAIKNR